MAASRGLILAVGLAVSASGCTSSRLFREFDERLVTAPASDTVAWLDENHESLYDSEDMLLFHLELGLLLHLSGDYANSNMAFESAKQLSEELYTKSLTREGLSLTTNDRVLAYEGESFEIAGLHVFTALNYVMLGDVEGALVEARQVDAYLARIQTDRGVENTYSKDPFARYLSALLFEEAERWNDAAVAYRLALDAYAAEAEQDGVEAPPGLLAAALAVEERLGGSGAEALVDRYGSAEARALPDGFGEAVIIHYNGLGPRKEERFFEISFGQGWAYVSSMQARDATEGDVDSALAGARAIAASQIIRVAFPAYVTAPRAIHGVELRVGEFQVPGHRALDLGEIARRSLEDRRGQTFARAAARAAFKYAISKGICYVAQSQSDGLIAAGICITAEAVRIASERADVRFWRSLPDEIWVGSVALPAGDQSVTVAFSAEDGSVVAERVVDVQIRPGRRTFAVVRTAQ